MDKCFLCEKNEAGKRGYINFSYKGLPIRVFKNGSTCKNCAKKIFRESFKKYRYLFKQKNGQVESIGWEKYNELCDESDATHLFVALGIFSFDSNDNYEIVSDDGLLSLNPRLSSAVYFKKLKDAVDYAKEKFSDAMYGYKIRKLTSINKRWIAKRNSDSDK